MPDIVTELVKGAFTLGAVALGSIVALRVYFRQKEYERTKQRYLEQGIDVVASELEGGLGVVSHNYARSLQLCKLFRDSGTKFDVKKLEREFLPLVRPLQQQLRTYKCSIVSYKSTHQPMKDTMLKFLVILSFAAAISACTPEQPSQQQTKIKSERSSTALTTEKPSIPQNTQSTQSTEQVKSIANDYSVSEERVNNVAGRAAELSGGNANKQDMLDALKAASGK